MRLVVTGRQIAVSSRDRDRITEKVSHLDRLLNSRAVSAQCIVGRERQQYVCELTVHAKRDHMLHGVGRGRLLDTAVLAAVKRVSQQAQRFTDRLKSHRNGAKVPVRVAAPAGNISAAPAPRVIRSRSYGPKPMTVDDAVLALTDGSDVVLVFRQAGSESVAVVYKRPDGHIGLVEPEA